MYSRDKALVKATSPPSSTLAWNSPRSGFQSGRAYEANAFPLIRPAEVGMRRDIAYIGAFLEFTLSLHRVTTILFLRISIKLTLLKPFTFQESLFRIA